MKRDNLAPSHFAAFSYPTGALNPADIKIAAEVCVEVYAIANNRWRVREQHKRRVFDEVPAQSSILAARYAIACLFKNQTVMWSEAGTSTLDAGQKYREADYLHVFDRATLCGYQWPLYGRAVPHQLLRQTGITSFRNVCPECRGQVPDAPLIADRVISTRAGGPRNIGTVIEIVDASSARVEWHDGGAPRTELNRKLKLAALRQ